MNNHVKLQHCYYEVRPYGKYIRVHAIDPDTGLEAIATGLRSMGQALIQQNAKNKLEYLINKKREEQQKR